MRPCRTKKKRFVSHQRISKISVENLSSSNRSWTRIFQFEGRRKTCWYFTSFFFIFIWFISLFLNKSVKCFISTFYEKNKWSNQWKFSRHIVIMIFPQSMSNYHLDGAMMCHDLDRSATSIDNRKNQVHFFAWCRTDKTFRSVKSHRFTSSWVTSSSLTDFVLRPRAIW